MSPLRIQHKLPFRDAKHIGPSASESIVSTYLYNYNRSILALVLVEPDVPQLGFLSVGLHLPSQDTAPTLTHRLLMNKTRILCNRNCSAFLVVSTFHAILPVVRLPLSTQTCPYPLSQNVSRCDHNSSVRQCQEQEGSPCPSSCWRIGRYVLQTPVHRTQPECCQNSCSLVRGSR